MGDKEAPASASSSTSAVSIASPSTSDVSAVLEKELASVGNSPAPSSCSFVSEQDQNDQGSTSRQSPFLSANQPSPGFPGLIRPDSLNVGFPDSETSSRSSLDGIQPSTRHQYRSRKRKNSSDSSSSEESVVTIGGESLDGIENSASRKSSKVKITDEPIIPGRVADAPRGRIANIRRESNCSVDSEAAHERMVKASQMVSVGFEESCTIDKQEQRRRPSNASAVGEPITVMTNSFLPNSCSPSPTRISESYKQCYSPSTQQVVRANVRYSPSPSPTQSPTRNRLLRSISPITTKSGLKRRYTNGDDIETKRPFARTSTSPLVTDRTFPYPPVPHANQEFVQPQLFGPGILSRRVALMDMEAHVSQRISVDSDDQKSVKDDISEPSSVQQSEEAMEMDESAATNKTEENSSESQAAEEKKTLFDEAMAAPLPTDGDDL